MKKSNLSINHQWETNNFMHPSGLSNVSTFFLLVNYTT